MASLISALCDEMCFMNKYDIRSQFLRAEDMTIDVDWQEVPVKCAEQLGYEIIAFNSCSFVLSCKDDSCFFIVNDTNDDGVKTYELFKINTKTEALNRFARFSVM